MVHLLDTLVSPFPSALSFLARFAPAMLRSHVGSPLPFLSKMSCMGSLESLLRGRGIPGRRSGDI